MISRIAFFFLFLTAWCFPALAAPQIGSPAPALIVKTMDGKEFDLSRQRGSIVIVHFWATWCPNCQKEMPEIDSFYRHNKTPNLHIIALSADSRHGIEKAREMAQKFSYASAMLDEAAVNEFGAPASLPLTYVIDRNGIVRCVLQPDKEVVTEKKLMEITGPLLTEK